ncbi:MAG: hypothetical protein ACFE0R_01635 [Salinarimonas sp.]
MFLLTGSALLALGLVLTLVALPNAVGVSPRFVRGAFGEHVYPLVCTALVVLGFSMLLAEGLARF